MLILLSEEKSDRNFEQFSLLAIGIYVNYEKAGIQMVVIMLWFVFSVFSSEPIVRFARVGETRAQSCATQHLSPTPLRPYVMVAAPCAPCVPAPLYARWPEAAARHTCVHTSDREYKK